VEKLAKMSHMPTDPDPSDETIINNAIWFQNLLISFSAGGRLRQKIILDK
jgi:hypothetical protein